MKEMRPNLPISADAQKSIKAFFYDFCKYMEWNYCATPDQLMLDWNSVSATLSYRDDTHNIFIRLWERSEGHLNRPDMTMIVETVIFDSKLGTRPNPDREAWRWLDRSQIADCLRKEMNAFSKWLILTARICGFKYVADPNIPPIPNEKVLGCPIACLPIR